MFLQDSSLRVTEAVSVDLTSIVGATAMMVTSSEMAAGRHGQVDVQVTVVVRRMFS
jgi:hypothetical protein